jgi:hypothetical protein
MKTAETYPQLMESLNDVRRQWWLRKVLEGALLAFAGTVAVLLATVAADNLFHLDTFGRSVLAFVLWGTLIASLAGLVVRRWLEDRRDDYFAALVEQKHPQLHNQLINALQLGRGNQTGHSPRLIEAIVRDAAAATADLDMSDSLAWRPVVRAGLFALAAVVFITGYAVALTPRFTNGLARVLKPGADIEPYTATRVLDVKPGDTRVPEGQSFLVEARVTGVIPAKATLYLRSGTDSWKDFNMDAGAEPEFDAKLSADVKVFRFKVQQPARSFDYYVTAGDGRSQGPSRDRNFFHVDVVKRPKIDKLSLTYTLPPYTGLPPRVVAEADGEMVDLVGTTVTVQVTANKPLDEQKTRVVVKDARAKPESYFMHKASADNVVQCSFVLWTPDPKAAPDRVQAPAQYQIQLWDTDGYDNLDPLWHSINVVKDQPPNVVIHAPGSEGQVEPDEAVALTVEARDDYGVGTVGLEYRIHRRSAKFDKDLPYTPLAQPAPVVHQGKGPPDDPTELHTKDVFRWELRGLKLQRGDRVECRATATDRNTLTGPGRAESLPVSLAVRLTDKEVARELDEKLTDFADDLEKLLTLQRENQAQTRSVAQFEPLVRRQVEIRQKTDGLARRMERSAMPLTTIYKALDALHDGLMVEAVKTLENARDAVEQDKVARHRAESLGVQERIVKELEALLLRMRRNEEMKKALRRIEKKDSALHKKITDKLTTMVKDIDQFLKDQTQLVSKLEAMPKKPTDEIREDKLRLTKEMEDMQKKWDKWAKGSIQELPKLPEGSVDDFKLRKDVNRIYEEIEKAATRSKAEKVEVSLEDMGVGLGTKMKEDLETWMPDSPDNVKWVMEEPLNKKTPKVPEMPLPKELEDLIGDLLQKADEFDEEADDITSAWGDNLDQAGWGTGDGPISLFSAKGKTGNDLPNSNELTGRSGDGRRGKSTGQMVGDTSRGLKGRPTPARVGNEKYEPGQLKQEGSDDPKGATGGGKKAGAGERGLQGGTPPDVSKEDLGRLSAKQAGMREKAEQVAKKLATEGIKSGRLMEGIKKLQESEKDLRDLRYDDAFRKRKEALRAIKGAALEVDQKSGLHMSRSRDLPPELRKELLQGADDGYPPGYETLLKNYYKELSKAEK